MSKEEQKKVLKDLGSKIVHQIKKGKNPEIVFPLRNLSNIVYDQKSKTLKLGNKTGTRSFFNVAHSKKFLQTIEVASVIKDKLLESGKHSSLRDVFYMVKKTIPGTKVNLVDDQTESDKAIEDLEVMTSLSREQMHVNANKNGSIAGKVIIVDKGDTIDWSKLVSGGWAIPSNVEEITFKNVDAKYVLCDGDIYGAYIYSVIKYGSIALAHASERLTIPGVKYVGITMDDIEKYDLKKHFITL